MSRVPYEPFSKTDVVVRLGARSRQLNSEQLAAHIRMLERTVQVRADNTVMDDAVD